MEGDYRRCGDCNAYLGFQSTPSAWRETSVSSDAFAASHISIHSLRMEGDRPHPRWTQFRSHFNPLPPHGGRHWIDGFFDKFAKISIHSLRMEGDSAADARERTHRHFNPLPPHGGRRCLCFCTYSFIVNFNPLPPHGGRHCHACGLWLQRFYFNPLPPHGGRPWRNTANDRYQHFNPLPPHGGRRSEKCWLVLLALYFNPLPPHGGRPLPSPFAA